jgi:hypothetical protein
LVEKDKPFIEFLLLADPYTHVQELTRLALNKAYFGTHFVDFVFQQHSNKVVELLTKEKGLQTDVEFFALLQSL